jgi:threonine dehydrogenase-like Zn-dependent dehydrogenase
VADHRALVITEPGVIALHVVADLVPGPGEVIARPVYVGVCGTSLCWTESSIPATGATR